eukprot:TRINITY_DN104341_c0_g1_i1.p1 TRINITY_DN104341_c0_g1~~TRINITY_DN104341_c0_g1_i1.p1  ORF type:complete len:255 (+),score=27.89 TRINITY_DN104341_c0_g1_i1:185-949(+)
MDKYGGQRYGMIDTPFPVEARSQASQQRSHSWSGSGSSSQASSGSTKKEFFSASHTERAMVAINNGGSDDDVDLDALVPAEASASGGPRMAVQSQLPENLVHRHELRRCIPCIELQLNQHCRNGRDCRFCHLPHDDNLVKEQRPTKEMRARCKKSICKCIEQHKSDNEQLIGELQRLVARQSPFLRHYTFKTLRDTTLFEAGDSSSLGTVSSSTKGGKQGGKGHGAGEGGLLHKGGKLTGYPESVKGLLGRMSL